MRFVRSVASNMRLPKYTGSLRDGPRATKLRYRLYADGTIIDQHDHNKIVGYILDAEDLDRLWHLSGLLRQRELQSIVAYLKDETPK